MPGQGNVFAVHSKEEFDQKIAFAGEKLVVIDFSAAWCGPCRVIAPVFEELSNEHTDVVFLKVDVDDVPEVAEEYGVNCMPTFHFVRDGDRVHSFSGADADRLRKDIAKHK